jgi:hypothetical protein
MGGEALRMHPHPTSSVEGEGKVRMTHGGRGMKGYACCRGKTLARTHNYPSARERDSL